MTLAGGTATTAVLAVQSLVVVPIALHMIGSSLYGAWLASGDVVAWMLAFDLGLPHLLAQRIGAAHATHDRDGIGRTFTAGLIVLGVIAVMTLLASLLVAPHVASVLHVSTSDAKTFSHCFMLAGASTAVLILSNGVLGYARGVQRTEVIAASTFAGTLLGSLSTIILLATGAGLWAFPLGLLIRAITVIAGNAFLLVSQMRAGELRILRPSPEIMRQFRTTVPISGLGGVSYQLMGQSESALIGIVLGPQWVTIYTITRRAADLCRALIDGIAQATFGGFAHLVASADRKRSLVVHAQITLFRLSLAVAAATAFVAANFAFVSLWVGPRYFGGLLLTTLMSIQLVTVGGSNLMNNLYRATGAIVKGAVAQVIEAVLRLAAAAGLLLTIGISGVPLAAIVASILAMLLTLQATRTAIGDADRTGPLLDWKYSCFAVTVYGAGLGMAYLAPRFSPLIIFAAAALMGAVGLVVLLSFDPHPLFPRLALSRRLSQRLAPTA